MTSKNLRASGPARKIAAAIVGVLALSSCMNSGQRKDLDLINGARRAAGVGSVRASDAAMRKAQGWSDHMSRTGVLEHTGGGSRVNPSPLAGWCSYAENVGYGASVSAVHDAFLNSATHRANMLGRYTLVGTGYTRKGSRVWVTEVYLRPC